MLRLIKKLHPNVLKKDKVYLYSAGFNVDKLLKGKERIEEEIEDLKILIKKQTKILLISHQGSYKKKNTIHLNFLINYLQKRLNTKIIYLKKKTIPNKKKILELLKLTQIIFLPNIRFFKGEELNSKSLAKTLSKLTDYVIVGGFSKAHRMNSSNNAILKYRPAYLSNGIFREIKKLKPWLKPKKHSLCILGGVKKEKITMGLNFLSKSYNYIIPAGLVLNTILKSTEHNIGGSKCHEKKELILAKKIYLKYKGKFLMPEKFTVCNKNDYNKCRKIELKDIKKNEIIVGFNLTQKMHIILKKCILKNSQIILAGTPSLISKSFNEPSLAILRYINKNKKNTLMLGGDTVSDLPFKGLKSSGGGSSLFFLSNKVLPVLENLYKNQKRFNVI